MKVLVVDSQTSANLFYKPFAYQQLLMFAQHQAVMAGIPFKVVSESDLADENVLNEAACIVAPYFINVQRSLRDDIARAIASARNTRPIGIITSGDFLTNDEEWGLFPDNPYSCMNELLGIYRIGETRNKSIKVRTTLDSRSIFPHSVPNAHYLTIKDCHTGLFKLLKGISGKILVEYDTGESALPALVASETGGRNAHFSNIQLLTSGNLLWRAIQWSVFGEQHHATLKAGRQGSLFLARFDMDQSKVPEDIEKVQLPLVGKLEEWKNRYNFVGSCYINITSFTDETEYTDWEVSTPIYRRIMRLGNEIGTHSYTHPFNIDELSDDELQFEFRDSRDEISKRLDCSIVGAAIPGNPEGLAVHDLLKNYFEYVTGRFSGPDAVYPGSIGFLFAGFDMVYFCPNVLPDYTAVNWLKMPSRLVCEKWIQNFSDLSHGASQPFIHCHWHDYGPSEGEPGYAAGMYDRFIEHAARNNTEFVTLADACQRIKSFCGAGLSSSWIDENTVEVVVEGELLGAMSIQFHHPGIISSVTDWYAFHDRKLFLPPGGGAFRVRLDYRVDPATRIVSLPMRSQLLDCSGDGDSLYCAFRGEGLVEIELKSAGDYEIASDDRYAAQRTGNRVRILFEDDGLHELRLDAIA